MNCDPKDSLSYKDGKDSKTNSDNSNHWFNHSRIDAFWTLEDHISQIVMYHGNHNFEYHISISHSKLVDIIPWKPSSRPLLPESKASLVKLHILYTRFRCCVDVPDIKILRFPCINVLAKKLIFLKELWEGTLARSGFVSDIPVSDKSTIDLYFQKWHQQ